MIGKRRIQDKSDEGQEKYSLARESSIHGNEVYRYHENDSGTGKGILSSGSVPLV